MDCPSEERLIRMALDPIDAVEHIAVDLNDRSFSVTHGADVDALLDVLRPLNLGIALRDSRDATDNDRPDAMSARDETAALKWLLIINGVMFVAEFIAGWLADSAGLLADSLDMLADAFVYSISLYAVGRAATAQRRAARISGIAQLVLALGMLAEVARRSVFGSEPTSFAMMGMASVALLANLACVALLHRHRDGGVHMKASWIFTTNDALANLGVIIAGALVIFSGSALPDLIIGALIGMLVLRGALRILRL